MPKLFCYGTLNVHDYQRSVWGEAKDGNTGRILDYEMKAWANSTIFYLDRKVGETVVGKLYELTDEQLEASDKYESDAYKRISLKDTDNGEFFVYIRNEGEAKGVSAVVEVPTKPVLLDPPTPVHVKHRGGKKHKKNKESRK